MGHLCVQTPSISYHCQTQNNWCNSPKNKRRIALRSRKHRTPSDVMAVRVFPVFHKLGNYYINKIQQDVTDAGIYLLQNHSTYFRCLSHTSSGVHITVTAASGASHSIRTITRKHTPQTTTK